VSNHVARWNGDEWSALGLGVGPAARASVRALAADGVNVYVGGEFTLAFGPQVPCR